MERRYVMMAFLLILAMGLVVPMAFAGKPERAKAACRDGSDNDGDGYADWPDDPGCKNKNDKSELDPGVECDDGSDNDGDSSIDMQDPGCSSPTDQDETDCGDGVCEGGETSGSCPEDCGEPDSCSDTDGGYVVTVFGTTSGYFQGEPYSHDDYCAGNETIMEYHCSGDYEQVQQQSCGTDGYVGSDYCMNGSVYSDFRDHECSAGECGYTDTPVLQEGCLYGCTNGTCDTIPDNCNDTDGGFVKDIKGMVSGYDEGSPYNYTDYCTGNQSADLVEYYCSGTQWDYLYAPCLNGTACIDGACV